MPLKQRKTISRSFRIDEETLRKLYSEAERAGISPNALHNQILKDYFQFYIFAKKFGIVNLSTTTLSSFVDCCCKEEIIKIADFSASTLVNDGMKTIGLPLNYESILFFIEKIFGGLAGWFKCNHYKMDNKEIFHLRHNLGNNWSVFITEVICQIFKNLLNEELETESMIGSVTLTRKHIKTLSTDS